MEKLKQQIKEWEKDDNTQYNFMCEHPLLKELVSDHSYRQGVLDGIKYALEQLKNKEL